MNKNKCQGRLKVSFLFIVTTVLALGCGEITASFNRVTSNLSPAPPAIVSPQEIFNINLITRTGSPDVIANLLSATPRYSLHEVLETPNGMWAEEALINGVVSTNFSGATVGTVGTTGSLPSGWSRTALDGSGLAMDVVSVDSGQITLRVHGTGGGGGFAIAAFNGTNDFPVSSGDYVTASAKIQLVAGSTTNLTGLGIHQIFWNAGNFQGYGVQEINLLQSDKPWYAQFTTIIGAGVTHSSPALAFICGTGPIDITLKITSPQIEKRAWRSSFAASRAADNINLASSYQATYLELASRSIVLTAESPHIGTSSTLWSEFKDTSNYIELQMRGHTVYLKAVASGTTLTDTPLGVLPPMSRFSIGLSISPTTLIASLNGKSPVSIDQSSPAGLMQARVGYGETGAWNGTIAKIKGYDGALTATEVQSAASISSDVFDDFDRADSSVLGSAPTGQAWRQTGATANLISNKTFVADNTATGASYAVIDLGKIPKYLGVVFSFSTGNTGGAVAMMSATNNFNIPVNALHQILTDTYVNWGTITTNAADTPLAQYTLISSLARDGSTVYGAAWFYDDRDGSLTWLTPQGELVRLVDASFLTHAGTSIVIEHFWQSGQAKPIFRAVMGTDYSN